MTPRPATRPNGELSAWCIWAAETQSSGDLDSVLMGRREAGREELLERLCCDQVRRWRKGQRVPVETYLLMHPRVRDDDEAAFELIYGEFLFREELGETPTVEELEWRFPRFAERLRRQVDLHEILRSDDGRTLILPNGLRMSPMRRGGPSSRAGSWRRGTASSANSAAAGMGAVYKAWQVGLKRVVAVKVIRADAYADAGGGARFQAEAEAAARFQHPNVDPGLRGRRA